MIRTPRVIVISPYSTWTLHSQIDAIVGKALQMRGAEVHAVTCDRFFKRCSVFRWTDESSKQAICSSCARVGNDLWTTFDIPFSHFGDYVTQDDRNEINQWIAGVSPEVYDTAEFDGRPIGEFIKPGFFGNLRLSFDEDLRHEFVRGEHSRYLVDGALMVRAVNRIYDSFQPTHLVLFNGRMAPVRIAWEEAVRRGIDWFCHERGFVDDCFSFFDRVDCSCPKTSKELCRRWADVPLSGEELDVTRKFIFQRESGENTGFLSYYNGFKMGYESVRRELRIPENARIFLYLTHSTDEMATAEEDRYLNILEMGDALIEEFRDRDEYLIIRHHPNIGGNDLIPPAKSLLSRLLASGKDLPPNVRIVMPGEKITSYALFQQADGAIIPQSTTAIEAVLRGVPTIVARHARFEQIGHALFDKNDMMGLREAVRRMLDGGLTPTFSHFRNAYRMLYNHFFRWEFKFKVCGVSNMHYAGFRFEDMSQLAAGFDPVLDRVCDRVLSDGPLYRPLSEEYLNRSTDEEESFLQREWKEVLAFRATAANHRNSWSEAPVDVIFLKCEPNDCIPPEPYRSRHSNIGIHTIELENRSVDARTLGTIIEKLSDCEAPYVAVVDSSVRHDESSLSRAIDFLEKNENQERYAVRYGAYVLKESGWLRGEVFSSFNSVEDYGRALGIAPSLQNPSVLLSLAVFRTSRLREELVRLSAGDEKTPVVLSLYELLSRPGCSINHFPGAIIPERLHDDQPVSDLVSAAMQRSIEHARAVKMKLSHICLRCPDSQIEQTFKGVLGEQHRKLMQSDLVQALPTSQEREIAKGLVGSLSGNFRDSSQLKRLLACMLYVPAHRLVLDPDLTGVPAWFVDDYFAYAVKQPILFSEVGEAERYFQHLFRFLAGIDSQLRRNPDSQLWLSAGNMFLERASLLNVLFSEKNLRPFYEMRDRVVRRVLEAGGYILEHSTSSPEAKSSLSAAIDQNRENEGRTEEHPGEQEGRRNGPTCTDTACNAKKKIRVGVLNRMFTATTETWLTLPLFEALDKKTFETHLYVLGQDGNEVETYARERADSFTVLPRAPREAVEKLRADNLDILMTGTNLCAVTHELLIIFSHRIAAKQGTLLSSPLSTGLKNMDFFVTGVDTEEGGAGQTQYTEKILDVGGAGFCFDFTAVPKQTLGTPTREAYGISPNAMVYVSGANFHKIIPEQRIVWARILQQVPNSVLVLYPFGPAWTNSYPTKRFEDELRELFESYGIGIERLVILPTLPGRADVLGVLECCDVYLDSYPHSGGVSLADPLEKRLAIVERQGPFIRSRHGAGILRELDLHECVVDTEAEYSELAVRLGLDGRYRSRMREKVNAAMNADPRFLNVERFGSALGSALEKLLSEDPKRNETTLCY